MYKSMQNFMNKDLNKTIKINGKGWNGLIIEPTKDEK